MTNNKKQNSNNSNAKLQVLNKKETATQKAAREAAKKKERAEKAKAKADEKENAKSALPYYTYGVIREISTSTPAQACKHFYLDLQALCGGAVLLVLSKIIGENKRDFYEIYGGAVKAKAKELGRVNYSQYLVWQVLWKDLQKYTRGQMKADKEICAAIEKVHEKIEERAKRIKAAKAAKAAKKAPKAE